MTLHFLFCCSALALGSFGTFAAHQLDLNIGPIDNKAGTLHVALYNNAEHYDAGKNAVAVQKLEVTSNQVQLQFAGLEAGQYAIKIMHDENNNGKLDRNMLGIPSEGYGFSNNAGQFGPASFADAAFTLSGDQKIQIQIR